MSFEITYCAHLLPKPGHDDDDDDDDDDDEFDEFDDDDDDDPCKVKVITQLLCTSDTLLNNPFLVGVSKTKGLGVFLPSTQ